ncbi:MULTISPECIES: MFS transporter [unclassified Streptomyces]|uniref:MFS transporter n=1 Tax=unclassified Streptomyces TaxID=2593676 RepID=UPI000C06BE19|nr:MFS transporter [Streptomyces sp. LamerLS-316]MYQ42423.1 MFS transporter [Streptomyces sp. SID4921]
MSATPVGRPAPDMREGLPPRTGMVRVGIGLLLGTVAWAMPFATGTAVLLPARIEDIAPDSKVTLLAVLTATAAVVGLVANIVIGALSDRTRSRLGARTPWIIGGGLTTAVFMALLTTSDTFWVLLGWWCLTVVSLNAMTATLIAIVPDRVPTGRRAGVSALVGVGMLLGHALGAVLGSAFLGSPGLGLVVAGIAAAVLGVLAVCVAPDVPNTASPPVPRLTARALLRSVKFPRGAPDFHWVLWSRLLLVLGYFMINSYQLYILTDHVGLSKTRAAAVLGSNSVLFLATAIVGSVLSGPLSDRTGRRKPFVIGASLVALLAIAIPLFRATPAGMTAFSCVGGLAFGCYYAVDAALMADVLPDQESRAKDLGILNVANTGGQALAPVVSSALVGLGTGYSPAFIGAMAACALGAILVVPIRTVR